MNSALLEISGLNYRYAVHSPSGVVLRSLSLTARRGEIIALIGPNGSGKSTLLKLIAGVMRISDARYEGSIRYEGEELRKFTPYRRARAIAYVPADLRSDFPMSAYEAVYMGRFCHQEGFGAILSDADERAIQSAMELCDCWDIRDRDLATLSGGEAQLVLLARAVAQGSPILLLDESLSRMDMNHQRLVSALIQRLAAEGRTIFWVAHDLNLVTEWATRALMLQAGEVVADGSLKDVITEKAMDQLYPGAHLKVAPSPFTGVPKVWFS